MTDIFSPTLIILVLLAIALGAGIGIGLMLLVQRSQSGGKTLAELRQEKEAYQNEVDAHFEKTAHLFKEMTENYRTLYEHMASGAQKLCQGEPVIQALDLPKPAALPDKRASSTQASTAPNADPEPAADEKPDGKAAASGAKPSTPEGDTPKPRSGSSSPQDVLKPATHKPDQS